MKRLLLLLIFSCTAGIASSQTKKPTQSKNSTETLQIVEASCGECQFKMKGNDCDLAVRIKGKAYFVDGTKIDDHGDAHASDGFCEKIRKAEVKGKVVNNRFVATHFKLLPEEKSKK
ncbi:DUF6370 family protein [Daejeonella lutea]|uniref:Glutaminyl-tRNA synthetase n=1 Tax=Daejeonella lutea TaxID=572036 RepID=A0A1T5DMJ9_9SPHI|nr:DUF6370 family protein [Daejeonella lutea]SKB72922.1 hypothetical protein SAMN05661099_2445 [Daejeonella lutea]